MKITVEFLSLPQISKIAGGKSIVFDFPGGTLHELIEAIAKKYGEKVGKLLFDDSGKLDRIFKVLLNKKDWISHDKLDRELEDGDGVTLMLLVGGG
ncbi:MAG: MoaD/ThiS family protein [Candidatus Aminicenantes bacterium]|nr:MoaD/ThiS family protein [Candidatus Aminicenantes bacterium]